MTDAELVRYLDGELDAAQGAALLGRVRGEPASAARLETLRRRSGRLSALLLASDAGGTAAVAPPTAGPPGTPSPPRPGRDGTTASKPAAARPGRRPPPTWLRLAAALVLVLGAAFAVPQARAWIAAQASAAAAALGIGASPDPVQGDGAAPAIEGGTTVRFPVSADTFFVETPRGAGRLVLRRGSGTAGSARVRGPAGAELVVLPQGLRVGGALATGTRIELVLPASVTAVRLHRGASTPTLHGLPPAGEELTLDLDG